MTTHAPFLRSINVVLDIDHPERVAHFRPTRKSVRLISKVLTEETGHALFLIAPYGSGKSITGAYLGHLVEESEGATSLLREVETRLQTVDAQVAKTSRRRRARNCKGLFVPLHGFVDDVPEALQAGITDAMHRIGIEIDEQDWPPLNGTASPSLRNLVTRCTETAAQAECDRVVVLWDEFGRHLQGLISGGHPEELDLLQVLAEIVTRSAKVPVFLILILHRSLLGYASGLSSGLRKEWSKIEGRFEAVQYVDDSEEVYELIGSLVKALRPEPVRGPEDPDGLATRARGIGLFPNVEKGRLAPILADASPLLPATLHLLPRVAARVAQNERTVFSFLNSVDLDAPVLPSRLYGFFRDDFRTDAGPGGTQRLWLEVESALAKVPAESPQAEVLATTFLLGLGLGGERSLATRRQVLSAIKCDSVPDPSRVIDDLVERNLMVHRRHSDQLVVWHGTDIDLRGRLAEEKVRGQADFDLTKFLSTEYPPPPLQPSEYNARAGVRRYFPSEYLTVGGYQAKLDHLEINGWDPGTDGHVAYVLPQDAAETGEAESLAARSLDNRLFTAVAPPIATLHDAALELRSLLRMREDADLIRGDPMVAVEIDHLVDDVQIALRHLLKRVLYPQPRGSRWYYRGRQLVVDSVFSLRRKMSRAMEEVFPLTPRINSEMVVRRKPNPVIVNARKKVELGVLERYGRENLGIQGNYADAAIFRCVFMRTGLYREERNGWRLAAPDELKDAGLSEVWNRVRAYFTEAGHRKPLRQLLEELREPPYGVREGVLPLLLTAGLRAFPTVVALRRRGHFVHDVLPSVIEEAARQPDLYSVDVFEISAGLTGYLAGIRQMFGDREIPDSGDLLQDSLAAVTTWRASIPERAGKSQGLSGVSRRFDRLLESADPPSLLLDGLPRLLGINPNNCEALLEGLRQVKVEIEGAAAAFREEVISMIASALTHRGLEPSVSMNGHSGPTPQLREQASKWASFFPEAVSIHLQDRVARAVLSRMQTAYADDHALADALATVLVGRRISDWDQTLPAPFMRRLERSLRAVEEAATSLLGQPGAAQEIREGLTQIVMARARTVAGQLASVVGEGDAAEKLEAIASDLRAYTRAASSAS